MADLTNTDHHLSVHGVHLVHLIGSDSERARIHANVIAKLNADQRKTLATHPLSQKNQQLLKRAMGSSPYIPQLVQKAVLKTYEEAVIRHHRKLDEKYKNRLEVFARHSKISPREMIFSLYQPDCLMVLAALAHDKKKAHFFSGMPGCSSAITRNGLMLLRNLDYPAAGHWEKWPAVFYHEPSETDYQNYVSIGSLGIHLAGLTGVNESGIAFSLHAHFSKKFSIRGTPIFFLGQEIMESAKTMDEAIFLCKNFRTIGSWAINLVSAKENRMVTVELSQGVSHVRETKDDPVHAHANGFQCELFAGNELHLNGSFFEDVQSRKSSLEKNLSQSQKLEDGLAALASQVDFQTGEQRVFGNTVCVVATIQSVAIDFQNEKLYVSQRNETPTPLGPFLSLPLSWRNISHETSPPKLVEVPRPLTGENRENFDRALHSYHEAYCSWQVRSDSPEITLAHLIQATEHYPEDPHLQMQRGYFELLLSKTSGHLKTALQCFLKASESKLSAHHHQVALYFCAACYDLLEQRDNAVAVYQSIALDPKTDAKLRKKAQERVKSPYQSAYCQKIVPDLQFVEPLEYL